jgi:RNA polymerase sigma-70 factor (ECF subfamily)
MLDSSAILAESERRYDHAPRQPQRAEMAAKKVLQQLGLLDLLAKAKSGDDSALEQLALRVTGPVKNAAYSIVRSRDQAEDIAQESLSHALLTIHQCHAATEGQVTAWFKTIATNRAKGYLRSPKGRLERVRVWDTGVLERYEDVPVKYRVEHRILVGFLEEELEQLAKLNREIFVRRYIDGESWEEIANALRITVGAATQRANRTKERLRARILARALEYTAIGPRMREHLVRIGSLKEEPPH